MRGKSVIRELVFDEEDKVDGVPAGSEQARVEVGDGLVDIWVEDDEVDGVTVDEPVDIGVDDHVDDVTADEQYLGENGDGPVDDGVDDSDEEDRGEDSDEEEAYA